MNREVIKRYKEAFDWWLEGGKVWVKDTNYPEDEWVLFIYPDFDKSDYTYVPDDEYAELRKAWHDGKKLQYYHPIFENWKDYNKQEIPDFKTSLFNWRIKPNEWYEKLDGTKENGVICWVWNIKGTPKVDFIYFVTENGRFVGEHGYWDYAEPIRCSSLKDFQKDEK